MERATATSASLMAKRMPILQLAVAMRMMVSKVRAVTGNALYRDANATKGGCVRLAKVMEQLCPSIQDLCREWPEDYADPPDPNSITALSWELAVRHQPTFSERDGCILCLCVQAGPVALSLSNAPTVPQQPP
eukprot:1149775-Pelagomonas_calceolata.AAC.12